MPTVLPSLSRPLPSIETACFTGEGLSTVIVTLPALALSEGLSKFSWPLSSAEIFRVEEAPAPPPDGAGAGAGACCAVVSDEAPPESELDLSSLPQPATARVARAAHSAAAGTFGFIKSSDGRCGVSRVFLRTSPKSGSRAPGSAVRVLDLARHHA